MYFCYVSKIFLRYPFNRAWSVVCTLFSPFTLPSTCTVGMKFPKTSFHIKFPRYFKYLFLIFVSIFSKTSSLLTMYPLYSHPPSGDAHFFLFCYLWEDIQYLLPNLEGLILYKSSLPFTLFLTKFSCFSILCIAFEMHLSLFDVFFSEFRVTRFISF